MIGHIETAHPEEIWDFASVNDDQEQATNSDGDSDEEGDYDTEDEEEMLEYTGKGKSAVTMNRTYV